MDDLSREIAAIRDELAPQWSEQRSERLYAGVGRLRQRRRRNRAIGAAALGATALMLAVAGVQWLPSGENAGMLAGRSVPSVDTETVQQPAAAPAPAVLTKVKARQRVRLADGSSALVASASGELNVLRNESARLELQVESGVAHFEVVPMPAAQRKFVVHAAGVSVLVVGTVFDVEQSAGRVRVAVSEGKVRVQTPNGMQFVAAGESYWFDSETNYTPQPTAAEPEVLQPAAADGLGDVGTRSTGGREHTAKGKRLAVKEDKPAAAAPKASWRSLCQSGDYDAAYRLLESGIAVDDDASALMDAADASRLSGHPEVSVGYLRRVLRDHRSSPVAPLAGFTLGRVLLERLGQPSEAAEAFALARNIAPHGSLAQDALAREVEAWSKAGNTHEAYQRAQLYVQQYPSGRRLRAVRLYGGLD
ncbi:MAG TPA: FecR domain-containing protein [Polyangiales bacterium]|nr:FecR domain-containing protein [Polyangiales bacterium]